MQIKTLVLAGFVVALTACHQKAEEKESPEFTVKGESIVINPSSPLLKKLSTNVVEKKKYGFELTTSGAVEAIPNNFAKIATPFSGRITKSYVHLGQHVSAGTPVFEISSPAFYETGKAYHQARQEMELAEKNYKRQRDLFSKNVGVQKELEEAEVNYEIKKKDFENARSSLQVFQISPSKLVLGQPLIVRSPISGIIVDNKIVIGQYVKDDAEPVATVAQLNKVWVKGQVKEKDIRYIKTSDKVDVKPVSFPDQVVKGTIYHINDMLDEETRSVGVIIECDNSSLLMKPGMYVAVNFHNAIENSVVIPSKAVYQQGDDSYVFVQTNANTFLRRKIKAKNEEKDQTIVEEGLSAGERIVVDGGFYLLDDKIK